MDLLILEEIEKGNIEQVEYLLDKNGLTFGTDWRDYHLLKTALCYKQKDIAKLLLRKGARVNKSSHEVWPTETSPLHLAISLGCPEIIEAILNKGASLDALNSNDESPLALAVLVGNFPLVDDILSRISTKVNWKSNDGLTHLHIASMRNRSDIIKRLLDDGAGIKIIINLKSSNWPGYTALHIAVEFQCFEAVDMLINYGADFTAKNAQGFTPLHLAFRNHNESIIDLIMSKHRYICENPRNPDGLSHFHIACTRSDTRFIDDFLNWGVNVNSAIRKDALKWQSFTPLSFAVHYQRVDVVKLLLLYNPTISKELLNLAYNASNLRISNLIYTKLQNQEYFEKRSHLLDLHIACANNSVSTVKDLLDRSVDLNSPTWLGLTPLHLAVQSKHKDIVQLLIDGGANVTTKDNRGKTALHLAFEIEENDIVDLILAAHINVKENPMDNTGLSHFHIACTRNNLNIIENFIKIGINVNSCLSSESVIWPGYTALHFACSFRQSEVVKLLINHEADVTITNGLGLTPLESFFKKLCIRYSDQVEFCQICDSLLTAHEKKNNDGLFSINGFSRFHLACAQNNLSTLKLLYSTELINQPVDMPNWSGRTPLHFAAYFNGLGAIKLLLDLGADQTIEDSEGFSALALGLHTDGCNTALSFVPCEELLYYNGNVNSDAALLHFHAACDMSYTAAVEYLLKRGVDINSFFGLGFNKIRTPLQAVLRNLESKEKNILLVELLLKNGADVNKANLYMKTPLHFAICLLFDDSVMLQILLNNGANVNLQNMKGDTPLHHCIRCFGFLKDITILLESGTDMNIENHEGNTFLTCFTLDSIEPEMSVYIPPMALTLIKHVRKLQFINFDVSDKNKQYCQLIVNKYNASETHYFVEAEFADECNNELDYMETFKLDNYTTLRDIIFKVPDKMVLHAKNIEFRRILESEDFRNRFPIYGFILNLQLKKGLERTYFSESGRALMKLGSTIKLPDSCYEHIIQYLTDEDLDHFIKVFHSGKRKDTAKK